MKLKGPIICIKQSEVMNNQLKSHLPKPSNVDLQKGMTMYKTTLNKADDYLVS